MSEFPFISALPLLQLDARNGLGWVLVPLLPKAMKRAAEQEMH